jgi:peptide/nickel transport system permease protein
VTRLRSVLARVMNLSTGIRTASIRNVAVVAFLLLIPCFRWNMMVDSALSLLLSLTALAAHPSAAWDRARPESLQYWLAIVTWCSLFIFSVRSLFLRNSRAVRTQISFRLSRLFAGEKKNTPERQLSVLVIAGFIVLSLMGPFVTPVRPDEQGELSTTRFAPPLSTATCRTFIPENGTVEEASDRLLRFLDEINHRLLDTRTVFARSAETPAHAAYTGRTFSIILLFGTDELGRDIFSRVVEGAKVSLGIGLLVAIASVCLGSLLGFLSGTAGRLVDSAVMRSIDIVLAVPPLFLIIAMLSFLGGSLWVVILVLTLTGWMGVARLVRAEILKLRESEYVLSARMLGVSTLGVVRNHLLPNVFPTILTASVLQLVNAILGESALSFLGLGVQPPTPSWGNMLGESTAYLGNAWWMGIFPGLALMLLVAAVQIGLNSFGKAEEQ